MHGKEFRVVFSSAEWFGTEFRECASTVFWFQERNSELYSLPQKGSEQNYGILLLFLFHGTEFRVIFFSAEGFGTEFRDFLFRGTTGIPSEITICSVYSVFRGIIFLSEIPNPTPPTSSPSPPPTLYREMQSYMPLFVPFLSLLIAIKENKTNLKKKGPKDNTNACSAQVKGTIVCRWFRFAQLAKGKKSRP